MIDKMSQQKVTRERVTTVNTFQDWLDGLKSQVEMWRSNLEEDEDVYLIVGEWTKEKFPSYSTKTPKEAAGSICKAAYAPDVFQEDKVMEAFRNSDKTLFGTLTMKSEDIKNPSHDQVYTLEEFVEYAEEVFSNYDEEKHVVVGGVAYDGYEVSAAKSNPYKRFNKQKFDPSIFASSPDSVGNLGMKSRLDWYGTIIVKQEYLSEKWFEKTQEKREGGQ